MQLVSIANGFHIELTEGAEPEPDRNFGGVGNLTSKWKFTISGFFSNNSPCVHGSYCWIIENVLYKKDHDQENWKSPGQTMRDKDYSMHRLRTKFPL